VLTNSLGRLIEGRNLFVLWKFNSKKVEISKSQIGLPNLAIQFKGYRLLHITDFHLGTWLDTQAMLEIVHLVNQQEPDLIAITGDFISFDAQKFVPDLIHILSKLISKDGILAVLGNHDHYTDANLIRGALEECNIIELKNSIHKIKKQASSLYFAGIDDHMTGHDDLQSVIAQIPDGQVPVILLAHEPDFADISAASKKFSLQLSGHTHGGQICLPLWGNLYLPRLGRKYPSGRYQVQNMVVYTNRGLGTSWLKFRYNCPPEIAIFEFYNLNLDNNR
jgi:predicted MPP superfamily phosphohydrolase